MKLSAAIDVLCKYAQGATLENEKAYTELQNMSKDFIEKLYDKYINQPNAPQGKIDINFNATTIVEEKKPISVKTTLSSDDPKVQQWANSIFNANKNEFLGKVKQVVSTNKISAPFESEVKVQRSYS